jgi:PKD repeat protein
VPTPRPTPSPTPGPSPSAASNGPIVAFSWSATGLDVQFRNQTKNAVSWTWLFGDGSISTARGPSHTYRAPGTYAVTLTAISLEGVKASLTQAVTVNR